MKKYHLLRPYNGNTPDVRITECGRTLPNRYNPNNLLVERYQGSHFVPGTAWYVARAQVCLNCLRQYE